MDKQFVAVTGFYCTGSSAVIDLLKEYDNVYIASPVSGDYEHMVLYSQGAFYDLASIMLSPFRSVYGSDMAVNEFIDAARRLNENDFGWYGSYGKYYGDKYIESVNKFVESISEIKGRRSAAHCIGIKHSFYKALLQIGAKIIYKRPITSLGRQYIYDRKPTYFAVPTTDEFNRASKEYILSYLNMCSKEKGINIFDHLLWPQQADSIEMFYPENFKMIIVYRDPRDIYLLNKYYWHSPPVAKPNTKPYYPVSTDSFCNEWRRTIPALRENNKVLCVQFEDLIYRYLETIKIIEDFLGLSEMEHLRKYTHFDPERSIENTQVFLLSEKWKDEIEPISNILKDYLYDFPYERIPDKSLWFDTDLQLESVKMKKRIVR